MKKLVMGSLAALAMFSVGCGGSEMDAEGDETATAISADETGTAEQAISGRYCVDQSYASAMMYNEQPFMCNNGPNWTTQLSRNHPLNIKADCGTYVWGTSLWTGYSYWLRKGALTPC